MTIKVASIFARSESELEYELNELAASHIISIITTPSVGFPEYKVIYEQ